PPKPLPREHGLDLPRVPARGLELTPPHLDACPPAVVAHAHLPETQALQRLLATLDPREPLARHDRPHRQPRREAGGRGLLGDLEPSLARVAAHVLLREPGLG